MADPVRARLLLAHGPSAGWRPVPARRIRWLIAGTIAYNIIEAVVAITAGTRGRRRPRGSGSGSTRWTDPIAALVIAAVAVPGAATPAAARPPRAWADAPTPARDARPLPHWCSATRTDAPIGIRRVAGWPDRLEML